MTAHLRFRLEELRHYVGLIGKGIVKETAEAVDIQLLEPAEPRYDAPPDGGKWVPIRAGASWGGEQRWAYFKGIVRTPGHWTGGAIDLRFDPGPRYLVPRISPLTAAGPEGQLFIDGERTSAIDHQHQRIRHPFAAGRGCDIRAVFFAARFPCRHTLNAFRLEWVDVAAEKLWHDLRVTLDIIDQLDEFSIARERLIQAVDAAVGRIDLRVVPSPSFGASVRLAQQAFDAARAKLAPAGDTPNVVAIGHAHIDLGWLWPIKQTHHKCLRTFATQCRLLDQYGGWVFLHTSPQAYAWVEKEAPDLFEKIKQRIEAGRWEAEGAAWVEMDTNLPNGESLARQLLYGKRYFKERLGIDSRLLWLIDAFGFSAALPQLLRLARVDCFVTSKISWNQYDAPPFDTFRWRGIDGTEIPTHYVTSPGSNWSPADEAWIRTYCGTMTVKEVVQNWQAYRQKDLLLDSMDTFGFGDGGGGPTEEMLETAERLSNMPPVAGIPRVKFERASSLLDRIRARADQLPVWDGELYLEHHRGVYTSQAWIKRANRKNEIRLHNAEWLASLARPHGFKPDKAGLDATWQNLLLLQFHDILPGSSVGELYEEVRPMHADIAQNADEIAGRAADAICARIDTSSFKSPLVLFNTLSWDRRDPIRLPDGTWLSGVTVPAGGWKVIDLARPAAEVGPGVEASEDGRLMSNRFWILRFDERGRISDLYDKARKRHVLSEGAAGNEWQLYDDRPHANDAWEIYLYYEKRRLPAPELVSMRVAENERCRACVELVWRLRARDDGRVSTITQRVVLYADNARIDFETKVDWQDQHQVLKVAFPVAVRATEAVYEIPFGYVRRPTHRNTSWDLAKFEVPAQRFADLSEHGYGVSLLNDCKYGYDIHDGVMRLTCLKSATSPDADADQGMHEFTYSLLPHAGSFQEAAVLRAAAELNNPVIARATPSAKEPLPAEFRFVECDAPVVVIDTLKPAEDGDGFVLRLYETFGSRCRATITLAAAPKSVELVNLLEEPVPDDVGLKRDGAKVTLDVRPFQIVSLRVRE